MLFVRLESEQKLMKLKKQKKKILILAGGRRTRLAELTGVFQTFKFEKPQGFSN